MIIKIIKIVLRKKKSSNGEDSSKSINDNDIYDTNKIFINEELYPEVK